MRRATPFAVVTREIDKVPPNERNGTHGVLVGTMEANSGSAGSAIASADKEQHNNAAFNKLWDLLRAYPRLYEEYCTAISAPESSIVFSKIIREIPHALATLALAEAFGILPLQPGFPHYFSVNLSRCSGDEDNVTIAPKIPDTHRELIREISEKLIKPYDGVGYSDDRIHIVLPREIKMHRLHIYISKRKTTRMNFRLYYGTRAVHEISERFLPPASNPEISYTEPLDLDNFSLSYTSRLQGPEISSKVSGAIEYFNQNPNLRRLKYENVLSECQRDFRVTNVPTNIRVPAAPAPAAPAVRVPAAPQHGATQPDVGLVAIDVVNAIPECPPSATHDNKGDTDGMDGYGDEDYELLLLGDHIADNPEQSPEDAPNLDAEQDIMHENQATNQARNEADTADDSIVEISYRRVTRRRKRSADEAQVPQESTSHRPARQATAYMSAEVHRRLEVTNESNINAEAQQTRSDTGEELPEVGLQGVASSEGRTMPMLVVRDF